ncbi:hypothetical protein [Microbulbifer aggregans]|uniref:hypothetical protein n=1 Tax=Microbulbifer aggregans TaxID=1769779 RepID=UPI001CFD9F22|nr:hypothetical protein [Microbulbifer aggregans]
MMFWTMSFWILALIMIVPIPFKFIGYWSGKDTSPVSVKIEETTNAVFMALGLVAFYGFISGSQPDHPNIWYAWLAITVAWSVISMFWSAKIKYAEEVMGKTKMRVALGIGVVVFSPMLVAVYLYASQA